MKSENNIFVAFALNLLFSVFEFFGGLFTGSVAIISDATHDLGDAASIGVSYFLEKKSRRRPDEVYTYGYARYSVIGGAITTLILLLGSVLVAYNAVGRLLHPTAIDYDGMILFAVVGVCVNTCAMLFTRGGRSLNQRAVNLHMLEDVLGWGVVLVGAVVMRFTDWAFIDPLMSIGVAMWIFLHAAKGLKEVLEVFLEKVPHGIHVKEIEAHLCEVEGVKDIHHVHIWSMDGERHHATLHVVANGDLPVIKGRIRDEFARHGIGHVTVEFEAENEHCSDRECRMDMLPVPSCHHHHH